MTRTNRRKLVRRRAFTLLEVLMVIVILGILAAIIVPNFTGTRESAEKKMAKSQVSGLESDMERFKLDCGRYPEKLEELMVKPDDDALAEKWAGPYLKKPAKDPWGRDLNYRSPGEYNQNSFDLWSSGPNGRSGDEDDITNWTKE